MQFNVVVFPKTDGQYLVVARSESLIFEARGATVAAAEDTLQRSIYRCFDMQQFRMMVVKKEEQLTRITLEKNNASV